MLSPEKIKQKYEVFHEYFTFKDFIGLSALIFGLLLANTPLEKPQLHSNETPDSKIQIEVPEKNMKQKKIRRKSSKNAVKRLKKQRVTAARKN